MAKKKAVKTEDTNDNEIDELVDDLLEDEEIESVYPEIEEKKEPEPSPTSFVYSSSDYPPAIRVLSASIIVGRGSTL